MSWRTQLHSGYTTSVKVKVKSLSRVRLFATPWTVAHQAPRSMGFSRQEYWSGLPFPSPGDLPDPGIEPRSPALQADAFNLCATREASPSTELSSLGVIHSCGKIHYQYCWTVKSVCHSELCSSELSCVEWLVQHNVSGGKRFAVDGDMRQRAVSTAAPPWHRPLRSRSASLPFNCPSPTGGTNTDQFLSALLPLYYQVRLAWMCSQSANLGCQFVTETSTLTLAFCVWGKGLPFDLFLGELPFCSLLQKTHLSYHSRTSHCLHFIVTVGHSGVSDSLWPHGL